MKFALFDSIMETHVVRSLERALLARGHQVFNTGKLAHGHTFITDDSEIWRVNSAIDEVIAFKPDAVLVFRPSSLPYSLLRRLRTAGGKLFAWFSDDPVLWKLSYGPVVDLYDVILHCGGRQVLEFYDRMHGRATGVNFPFWSDGTEFPYVYGSKEIESDAIFLGNVGDKIRRRRYYQLGQLGLDLRIHGQVGDDYFNLSGGYLDSQEEIWDAGARARLAINIPQVFTDHREAPTWFDGLEELGFFEIPSRVVQCAAMGLPMVSLLPPGGTLGAFPEIVVTHDLDSLRGACRELLGSGELEELSVKIRRRFEEDFSADARAAALEQLMHDDAWRELDVSERAVWYREASVRGQGESDCVDQEVGSTAIGSIDAMSHVTAQDACSKDILGRHVNGVQVTGSLQRLALIGRGRGDHFSALRIATRSLGSLGHEIIDVLPDQLETCLRADPFDQFAGLIDMEALDQRLGGQIDAYVLVGAEYLPIANTLRKIQSQRAVKLVVHAVESKEYSERLARLVSVADAASFVDEKVCEAFNARGFESAIALPDLVDREFLRLVHMQAERYQRAVVIADSKRALRRYSNLIEGLAPLPADTYVLEEEQGRPHGLAAVARLVNSTLVLVLADDPRTGKAVSRLLGHCLLGGGLVIVPRGQAGTLLSGRGETLISAANGRELRQKLGRLATDFTRQDQIRSTALRAGLEVFAAEEGLSWLLEIAHSSQYSRVRGKM